MQNAFLDSHGSGHQGMPTTTRSEPPSPSELIDARIAELGDWRGRTLAHVRALIREADPDVVEEWKWRGVPVWSDNGIICTGETYKAVVKLTFAEAPRSPTPRGCSTPASKARPARHRHARGRRRWTRPPSRR